MSFLAKIEFMEAKKLRLRDIAVTLVFAFLYFTLNYLRWTFFRYGSLYILVVLDIANSLIPFSILFGWPVIAGVTIGSLISLNSLDWSFSEIVGLPFPLGTLQWTVVVFLGSLAAWKIRGLKTKMTVNVLSVIGAILAVSSLLLPWWFFNIQAADISLFDFTVFPGWFGGDFGFWISAITKIAQWTGLNPFSATLESIQFTMYLLIFGALVAAIGGFLRKLGRILISVGLVLCSVGVGNFFSSWNQSLNAIGMPAAGSRTVDWLGYRLAEASWNWTWGMYLAIFACFILLFGVVLHPHMPQIEISDFIGCVGATVVMTIVWWVLVPDWGPAERLMALLYLTIFVGILGYVLMKCLSITRLKLKPT